MVNVKKSARKYGQETRLKRGAYNGAGFENSKKICEFL